MKKFIIGLVLILVLIGVGYLFIPAKHVDTHFDSESIDLVPSDAFLILRSNQPFKNGQELLASPFGRSLFSFDEAKDFFGQMNSIDSIITNNIAVNSVIGKTNLLLSVHKTGANSKGVLGVIKVQSSGDFDLKKVLETTNLFSSIEEKMYDEKVIYNTVLKSDNPEPIKLSIVQYGNCMAITNSSLLAELVVRHEKSGQSLVKQKGFKKLFRTSDESSDANVYVNFSQLGSYLSTVQSNKVAAISDRLKLFGDWMTLDLRQKDKSVMMNGFSFVDDSLNTFLSNFKGTDPQKLSVTSIMPNNTAFFAFQGFGDFATYHNNFKSYLSTKQMLYSIDKNISTINNKYKIDIEKDLFSWIGSDVCTFITEGSQEDVLQNLAVAIKIKDVEIAQKSLEKIIKATGGTFDEVTYLNYKIGNLGLTNLFPLVLGDFYSGLNKSYFCMVEDYIIFANDISNLKHIVNSYMRGKTLVKNIHFNNFSTNLSDLSNYLVYFNFKLTGNFYNEFLSPELASQFSAAKDSIQNLDGFAIQFINNSSLYFTNVYLNKKEIEANQVISLIECKLDTSYSINPWMVVNHYTKEKELLVQDNNNKLYLINNVGKVLWSKKLKNQIVGDVFQVDRYKNDKLQYIFGTGNELHLIDREGNYVSGFPVKLKSTQTKGVAVMDYDQNRNYRILIPSKNKLINYNIEGKIVDGWDFNPNKFDIAASPELLIVGKKDYIIVPDNGGNVRVLNRKGEDRIKLNTPLPSNRNKYEILKNTTLSNSGVFTTDTNGTLFFLKLTDELEPTTIKAFTSKHQFYLSNINNDNSKDVAYFDDETIYAYKLSKKGIVEIDDINFKPTYGVEFHHANEKMIICVTDAATGKIYAYNEEGMLYDNFPIESETPSLVVDLDGDGRFEFIVGDGLGSLYFYKIF